MSQERQILKHMQDGYAITQVSAFNLFGCGRLASRIYNLRREGYDIAMLREKNRRNDGYHARYILKGKS